VLGNVTLGLKSERAGKRVWFVRRTTCD